MTKDEDSPHPIRKVHVAVPHTYVLHSQLPWGFHGSVLALPSPQLLNLYHSYVRVRVYMDTRLLCK